jgi:hypothetical protein
MIKSIERTRAKSIKSYNESRVLDEIKGAPLYQTRQLAKFTKQACEMIVKELENLGLSSQDLTINSGPKNDVINITLQDEHQLTVDEINNFIRDCRKFGQVKYSDNPRWGSGMITIILPRDESEQQQKIEFNVPNIPDTTDVTTDRQRQNGTVAIEDDMTGDTYFLQSSGYVRCRRAHSRPGAPQQNLMAPGGGTPDEMVKCMIRAIERARTKPITHYESVTRQDVKLALQEIKRRHAAVK